MSLFDRFTERQARRRMLRGDKEGALRAFRRLLAIYEGRYGSDSVQVTRVLVQLARTATEATRHDEAVSACRRLLGTPSLAQTLPPIAIATIHEILGDALYARGDLEGAVAAFNETLQLVSSLDPTNPLTPTLLERLAGAQITAARPEEAARTAARAIDLLEAKGATKTGEFAALLAVYAEALTHSGRAEAAVEQFQRALAIANDVYGRTSKEAAVGRARLARTYCVLGQYSFAVALCRDALHCFRIVQPPDLASTALAYVTLGEAFQHQGQHAKALPEFRSAIDCQERALGKEHPGVASTMHSLAISHNFLGDYEQGVPIAKEALAKYVAMFGDEGTFVAGPLATLAGFYRSIGAPKQALPLMQKSLAIRERNLGASDLRTVTSLGGYAACLRELGRIEEAAALNRRALELLDERPGTAPALRATLLTDLGRCFSEQREGRLALECFRQATELSEGTLGPDHPLAIECAMNVGEELFKQGHPAAALPIQMQVVAKMTTTYDANFSWQAVALAHLALTQEALGHQRLAIVTLKRSVSAAQQQRFKISAIGADELISYTSTIEDQYQTLASWLLDQDRFGEALQVLELLKESEYFDFIRRRASEDPRVTQLSYTVDEAKWVTHYQEIADRLVSIAVDFKRFDGIADDSLTVAEQALRNRAADDLAIARQALQAFLEQMHIEFANEEAARAADIAESTEVHLGELQALIGTLGTKAALVNYFLTREWVNILLISPVIKIPRKIRISRRDLQRKIMTFSQVLRDPAAEPTSMAHEMFTILFAPIVPDLAELGTTTIMLSLDGPLRYLPFSALHDGHRYLAEQFAFVSYSPVTRTRLTDRRTPPWDIACLGTTRGVGAFSPLPAVVEELTGIVRHGSEGILPGVIFLDDEFTLSRLRSISEATHRVMHIASHFVFSPGTEENSYLLMGDGDKWTLEEMRSGQWRLDNKELLTLSACETGLGGGRDERGKEIEGFAVAAQNSGARTVLATLWKVSDRSTAAFMHEFYRQMEGGAVSTAEAIRQAQLSLLRADSGRTVSNPQQRNARPSDSSTEATPIEPRTYSHPFFWAPFILMGNWL